jgi:uncharacterized protein YjbJ (UPF0337 family)
LNPPVRLEQPPFGRIWHQDELRTNKEELMNWDRIEGNWKMFKGQVQQQWGKLTNDDLDIIAGNREELIGRIQNIYGIARDDAERQVTEWEKDRKVF